MASIKNKNKIYKKIIKAKSSTEKNILYNEFKNYRNLITKLSRISKARHYHHYFTDHKKRTCSKLGKELNYFFPEAFKCSVREMRYQLISNHHPEHLNTLGIISHCTDSFHVKPTTPGHPIPKISTHLFSDQKKRGLKDRVCENNPQTRDYIIRKEIRQMAQEMLNWVVNNFIVRAAVVLSYSSVLHGTNIVLILEKYNKSLLILEWFTPKEFYNLPGSVEKKS